MPRSPKLQRTQDRQSTCISSALRASGPRKCSPKKLRWPRVDVDERYGIAGRRVLLVNDRRDFDRHPLASRTALARTLAGIGARMNRDHDVLFLALSSHGMKNPHLVVENGALPLDELTADALAEILRASRIRWKVLVISACYAGAFIEPLRDANTVIITAAAPDRMSFGCNDQRALTYFGEAFYRDALPGAASLREAFDLAVADIERRERAAGLKPSQPQAHFGAAIEHKLVELETVRAARLRDGFRPQPAEGTAEQQRVDQPVEHELDRGAPLARVPDRVVQQPERERHERGGADDAEHGQVVRTARLASARRCKPRTRQPAGCRRTTAIRGLPMPATPLGRTVMSHTGPSAIFCMNSGERISAMVLQRGSM